MGWLVEKLELSRGNLAANIRPMEGLRGFAVFLVFMVHYATLVRPWLISDSTMASITDAMHATGNIGVDLFFVLSGYLIYGSLMSKPQPFLQFILRRIKRIYPTFTVVFFVYICLSFVFSSENKIPEIFSDALIYLLQNFLLLPGIFPIEPMITVAWSLSYEMFYYMLTPLLLLMLTLRTRSQAWRIWFFVALAIAIWIVCAALGGPIRLSMFVAGILLYEVMSSQRVQSPSDEFTVTILVSVMLLISLPAGGQTEYAVRTCLLFFSLFVLCFTCFKNPRSWLGRAFSWAPLRWLGNMSYSYYLIHGLALKAGFWALPLLAKHAGQGNYWFWSLLPIMFGLTVAASLLLFLMIERPISLAPSQACKKDPALLNAAPARRSA